MALFHGMDRPDVWGQAFNFGTGLCLAVPDVVAKIQRFMRREHTVPLSEPSERREILHQQLSSDKAKERLDWTPVYSLEKGLPETIEWYTRVLTETDHLKEKEDQL